MTNLWNETVEALQLVDKTWSDVKLVVTSAGPITKENYMVAASAFDYDEGFGSQEVDPNLKIVGDGWILIRDEYDGSEWFRFVITGTEPTQPFVTIKRFLPYDVRDSKRVEVFEEATK